MAKIEQIRKAVEKNRGGLEGASDQQIMIIWNQLGEGTRASYLESVKPKTTEGMKTKKQERK